MTVDDMAPFVLEIYKQHDLTSFPIDVFGLLIHMGYDLRRYSNLSQRKRAQCMELSPDACTVKKTIYYNDEKPEARIRFSLMHELGHIVTGSQEEKDADLFAGCVLAPPTAIVMMKECNTYEDVMRIFGLSEAAANIALGTARHWSPTWKTRPLSLELRDMLFPKEEKPAPEKEPEPEEYEPPKRRLLPKFEHIEDEATRKRLRRKVSQERTAYRKKREELLRSMDGSFPLLSDDDALGFWEGRKISGE